MDTSLTRCASCPCSTGRPITSTPVSLVHVIATLERLYRLDLSLSLPFTVLPRPSLPDLIFSSRLPGRDIFTFLSLRVGKVVKQLRSRSSFRTAVFVYLPRRVTLLLPPCLSSYALVCRLEFLLLSSNTQQA